MRFCDKFMKGVKLNREASSMKASATINGETCAKIAVDWQGRQARVYLEGFDWEGYDAGQQEPSDALEAVPGLWISVEPEHDDDASGALSWLVSLALVRQAEGVVRDELNWLRLPQYVRFPPAEMVEQQVRAVFEGAQDFDDVGKRWRSLGAEGIRPEED